MRAIIVGGGIGGLATALGLHRIGCEVEVYERAARFSDTGAALSIWGNGLYALNQLGVADQTLRLGGHKLSCGVVTDHAGKQLKPVNWDRATRATGFAPIAIYRPRLIDALLAPIQSHVRTNADCCRIDVGRRSVRVEFQDGREAEGDFLIAADGVRSQVRALMYPNVEPKYAGYVAYQSVVDSLPHHDLADAWHFSVGQGRQFGYAPLGKRQSYWFGTKNVTDYKNPVDARAEAMRHFCHCYGPIPELIANSPPENIVRSPIFQIPKLKSWGRGRMTLLGDAAHAMTPNLGQGACQALEDAVVLAACVQQCGDARDISQALRAFEKKRRPYVSRMQRQSDFAGWLMQSESRLTGAIMRTFLQFIIGGPLDAGLRYASHRCDLPICAHDINRFERRLSA